MSSTTLEKFEISTTPSTQLERALEQRVGTARFELWFRGNTKIQINENHILVGVPNRFYCDWLESQYLSTIQECANQVLGFSRPIRFHIDPALYRTLRDQQQAVQNSQTSLPELALSNATTNPNDNALGTQIPSDTKITAITTEIERQKLASQSPMVDRVVQTEPERGNQSEFIQQTFWTVAKHAAGTSETNHRPPTAVVKNQSNAGVRKGTRFNLSRFVVGSANRVAHAAVLTLLEQPRDAYSPLFFYGPVSTGKTHLLKGLEEGLKRRQQDLKIRCFTCEEFANEFIEAMRQNRLLAFRKQVRHLDVLLIDDIQFLSNKRATQEEFLHTLEAIHLRNGKVVLTCDCHPKQLTKIVPELRSRLVCGLVTRLDTPDRMMRALLIQRKATERQLAFSNTVLEYLNDHLPTNLRELEGALNYLQHSVAPADPHWTLASIQRALSTIIPNQRPVLQVSEIRDRACALFGINPKHLQERSRQKAITQPRMLVLYLARKFSNASYKEIGQCIGGLAHSSVIAAEKKIQQQLTKGESIEIAGQAWLIQEAIDTLARELGQ